MKRIITVAIALASINAFAQTETAAPAAAPAATTATAPVKKVKAAKKVAKKASNPKAEVTATSMAPVAEKAMAPAAPVAAAPAAGTSTATAAAPAAPVKKFGAGVSVYSTADYVIPGDVQTLTSANVSYKVTEKITLKAKQTWETLSAGPTVNADQEKRDKVNESNFRRTFADLTVSSKLPGMMGSNEMPVSLNHKIISGDAVYSQPGGGYGSAQAMWEANLSIPYSLTPKMDFGIDTQWRHVVAKSGAANDSNRLFFLPQVSYTINDMVSVYQTAGMMFSFRDDKDWRQKYTRVYLETGVSLSLIKNLSIGLDVSQDKAIAVRGAEGERVSNFDIYNPTAATGGETFDAVAYEGVVSYSF